MAPGARGPRASARQRRDRRPLPDRPRARRALRRVPAHRARGGPPPARTGDHRARARARVHGARPRVLHPVGRPVLAVPRGRVPGHPADVARCWRWTCGPTRRPRGGSALDPDTDAVPPRTHPLRGRAAAGRRHGLAAAGPRRAAARRRLHAHGVVRRARGAGRRPPDRRPRDHHGTRARRRPRRRARPGRRRGVPAHRADRRARRAGRRVPRHAGPGVTLRAGVRLGRDHGAHAPPAGRTPAPDPQRRPRSRMLGRPPVGQRRPRSRMAGRVTVR